MIFHHHGLRKLKKAGNLKIIKINNQDKSIFAIGSISKIFLMYKIILSLSLLFSTILLQSQVVETTLYYSIDWEITRTCNPVYIKKGKIDVDLQKFVEEFSLFSNDTNLICKGAYDKEGKKEGQILKYYQDGIVEYEGIYSQGDRQGKWKFNYSNGDQKALIEFAGDNFTVIEFRDTTGKYLLKKGSGSFEFDLRNLGIEGTISGSFKKGKRDGSWFLTSKNGKKLIKEEYNQGIHEGTWFLRREVWEAREGIEFQSELFDDLLLNQSEEFNCVTFLSKLDYPELPFLFFGGDKYYKSDKIGIISSGTNPHTCNENEFYQFLGENLHYPEEALKDSIQGTVYIAFIVEPDGTLADIEIVKGFNELCDEEALRVMKMSPRWMPALSKEGKPIRFEMNFPVRFKL